MHQSINQGDLCLHCVCSETLGRAKLFSFGMSKQEALFYDTKLRFWIDLSYILVSKPCSSWSYDRLYYSKLACSYKFSFIFCCIICCLPIMSSCARIWLFLKFLRTSPYPRSARLSRTRIAGSWGPKAFTASVLWWGSGTGYLLYTLS